jgi:hypothetical protein
MHDQLLPFLKKLVLLNLDGYYGEISEMSFYKHPLFNVPFNVSEIYIDQIPIIYVDLYPLINNLEPSMEYLKLSENIRKIVLTDNPFLRDKENSILAKYAAFTEATFQGGIEVNFESVIIQSIENFGVSIIVDEECYKIADSCIISPLNFQNVSLKTSTMKILPGNGFYIKTLVSNVTINFWGEDVRLISFMNNGSKWMINGNKLSIKTSNCTLLMKMPQISVIGKGSFQDFFTYKELHKKIGARGDYCVILGEIFFSLFYGDTYSIADHFDYSGKVTNSPLLYEYNEWKYSIGTVPYFIIFLFILYLFKII